MVVSVRALSSGKVGWWGVAEVLGLGFFGSSRRFSSATGGFGHCEFIPSSMVLYYSR